MKPKVYIDGKEGTTGLQIYDRLASRDDIELLLIDETKRKDPDERKKLINAADITFLCLPDAAAKEAVSFVEKDSARIIDASTAHRTAPGWAYGIPELSDMHKDAVVHAKFTANPGLPCVRIRDPGLSARGVWNDPEGDAPHCIFPHRILWRRKEDDRGVRVPGEAGTLQHAENLRSEPETQTPPGDAEDLWT